MENTDIQVDVIIPTQTKYLDLIGSIGERIGKEIDNYTGDKKALAYQLNLVLTEATTNAIKHSAGGRPLIKGEDKVRITINIQDDVLEIKVYDHGQGFDLENVPIPDFENPKEGGMGIYFIRTLMDSVSYKRLDEVNVLEIRKKLR
ncbi:ATP-binding protein [Methylicorpusculum oleiharenae]|uniref:ATP-binding protein n=1 Tax=Methylicorpusculum oleiharenae TaxID=1338687 RepID=UPI00135C5888|nr:ATP-binding protein [Methylicorpusculum oleiharenae]MCD2452517.1 ATP-binding protein [Methylicorpusculum oleiharenae]